MVEQLTAVTTSSTTDALAFIYHRHSTRSFAAAPLAAATVDALLDAAVHAPTAMHEEPCRFVVIQSRSELERVSDAAKRLATADAAGHGRLLKPPGESGDGIASILADREFNIFYDAGTAIVICTEQATEFAIADCWLAAENLMLAAAALGLGSCCIGFAIAALNSLALKEELGIPARARVVAAIALGKPRGGEMPVPRKPAVVWNWIRDNPAPS